MVGILSRLDDETSDTAAANFGGDAPRVPGHQATTDDLKRLSGTLDGWLQECASGGAR